MPTDNEYLKTLKIGVDNTTPCRCIKFTKIATFYLCHGLYVILDNLQTPSLKLKIRKPEKIIRQKGE